MAIGLTPKHVEEFTFNDLTQQQFIALAYQTAINLKWEVSYISNNGLIAFTNNGLLSWNAEVKISLVDDLVRIQSSSTGSEMIDFGKNKKNIAKFDESFEALKQTFSTTDLDAKYQEFKEQLVAIEEYILILPPPTTAEKILSIFSIFVPKKDFFITPILIDLNILIFIIMVLGGANIILPDNDSLLNWGANFRPITLQGQWWRLITNCFLHIGIFHLLMNLYALLYVGVLLEPYLGRTRFIAAYLLTGIMASIVSLAWHDLAISAGASGAIFGMYGVFLAMLTTNLIEKNARKALLTSIAIFVGYNLMNGFKEGIDNAAHIGGLLTGLLIGYAFVLSLKKPEDGRLKYGTVGLLSILILISSFVIYTKIPNDIAIYEIKIKDFVSLEEKAMAVYNLPENTSDKEILEELTTNGINNWKEIIKLIEGFKELDLPEVIKNRNLQLIEYCELRIKNYELIYKAISEDTNIYQPQIEAYNKQIESKLNELSGVANK